MLDQETERKNLEKKPQVKFEEGLSGKPPIQLREKPSST